MYALVTQLSVWAIPFLLSYVLVYALYKKVPVYDTFILGAKSGFGTAIRIMPHLVGMMVAITIFRESGALDVLLRLLRPVLDLVHFPAEVLPLSLLRPITGSGSLAITTDLIAQYGPDSYIGRLASTIQGSTDTTLYVLTVYFGAVAVRNTKYALKVGLMSDFIGVIASLLVVWFVFG
ncbi:spore maturation protein B [Aneurinibacillus thermoaerophilus]|uniref:Spore maturation protein B n=1 Tax=Aneurinibacillus thermoaerophilus TaxID=143495 RepID=A0A1G7XMI5_ANETH|nr:nucleoside recognition domain-containing protein [Aneurinibacillus thermoaerophilus]MED0675040.1 spore maturation protein [Aneurinibacillus thermoaerophilus]SDG85253.1 spore maturation protein B [Aneurinibacillus thermoaerophilus]